MECLCRYKLGTLFYLVKLGFTFIEKKTIFEMSSLAFAYVKMQIILVYYEAVCLLVINRS